jgi:hydroxyacylglutathione hydrolase
MKLLKTVKSALAGLFLICSIGSSAQTGNFKVITCEKSEIIPVKCYLLYDAATKEAALFDAGAPAERVAAQIENNGLKLRYILITHGHPDHIEALPAIRQRYPSAKVCFMREEYEDMKLLSRWREIFSPELAAAWGKDPGMVKLMDFDYSRLAEPDVYLTDGQEVRVGGVNIKVFKTPGHSRGSATYSVGNVLIPGDLILHHSTGDLAYSLCSRDDIVTSIRRLYTSFPDETILLAGHGDPSTIGYEKTGNKNITLDRVVW